MSNVIAELTTTSPAGEQGAPVEIGERCRCMEIAIAAESAAGALTANEAETIVDVLAETDCWIVIDTAPVASDVATKRRAMASGERRQFWITTGQTVAVIARTAGTA